MTDTQNPALKEIFNLERLHHFARELTELDPSFDGQRFIDLASANLETLGIMQRLRRIAETLGAVLPGSYGDRLDLLKAFAPRIDHGFASIVLPEFVALHGLDDPASSLDALAFFTRFGSSEFAIRHFLLRDLPGTLAVMKGWAENDDAHVRRLASEGSRPRLPWSFQLKAVMADPSLTAPILARLNRDPSLYVRKSVANHLNDITKDNPDFALASAAGWDRDDPRTAWIVRHALRNLIKQGHPRALALIGIDIGATARLLALSLEPASLSLGETLILRASLHSTAKTRERFVIDYAVHYVRKNGPASRKVFKLKELTLLPGETASVSIAQTIRDFTTRKHYPGYHRVELMANGAVIGESGFDLV